MYAVQALGGRVWFIDRLPSFTPQGPHTGPSLRVHPQPHLGTASSSPNRSGSSPPSTRVGPAQARRVDEMQAVADALSLLANIVMAWNTAQMQAVLDRWANRRQIVPPELTGRIAPTRLEGINLRGVFRFPLERYAGQILPSQTAAKTSAGG